MKDKSHEKDAGITSPNIPPKHAISDSGLRNNARVSIPLVYLLLGCLYILFSGLLVANLSPLEDIVLFETLKGLVFVVVTAIILYFLLAREQRKRASSEMFFRTLVDSMEDAVFVLDASSRKIIYANSAASRIFGFTNEQILGRSSRMLHASEEHFNDFRARGVDTLGKGKPFHTEFLMRRSDGSLFPTSHIVCIMQTENSPPMALSVVRDYSLIKDAEEKFREQETMMQHIAASLSEVFWVSSVDKTRLYYLSPAYAEVWGRDPAEILNDPTRFLDAVVPEDRDRVEREMMAQAEGEYDIQYRIRKPDGEVRWIRDRAKPIADDSGEIYRIVGVAEDFTDLKMKEEELMHASKMESMGQLTSGIAHDFRNYLTVVLGNAELLNAGITDPEMRVSINHIIRGTQEATNLSERLLAFSRRNPLREENVDINAFVEDLLPLVQPMLKKNIRLECDLAAESPNCKLDRTSLETAVINLITNARDAMPKGGTITLSTKTEIRQSRNGESKFVHLEVSDDGEGIRQENLLRIFEPYFSTKGPGKGTGLGLSMVHGFVNQSGGTINVESTLGEGTSFHLMLPCDGNGPPDARVPAANSP